MGWGREGGGAAHLRHGRRAGYKGCRRGSPGQLGVGGVESPERHQQARRRLFLLKEPSALAESKGTSTHATTMPNFSGNWKIIRSENFEDLLKVLGKEVFERPGGERDARILLEVGR